MINLTFSYYKSTFNNRLHTESILCQFPNLTELERICQEKWEKLPESRYEKLVEAYPGSLKSVIASKRGSYNVLN